MKTEKINKILESLISECSTATGNIDDEDVAKGVSAPGSKKIQKKEMPKFSQEAKKE